MLLGMSCHSSRHQIYGRAFFFSLHCANHATAIVLVCFVLDILQRQCFMRFTRAVEISSICIAGTSLQGSFGEHISTQKLRPGHIHTCSVQHLRNSPGMPEVCYSLPGFLSSLTLLDAPLMMGPIKSNVQLCGDTHFWRCQLCN